MLVSGVSLEPIITHVIMGSKRVHVHYSACKHGENLWLFYVTDNPWTYPN